MQKDTLIVVSLCAVILLVLGSLSNCLRVETVQGCDCDDPPCWVELSGVMGNNNWYVSDVYVGFNGSFYEINYRIDGGSWQTYTAPFSLTTEGIHLFEWYCDDNMSNIGSIEIKIDKTAPLISINYSIWRKYWKGYLYTYNIEALDKMSGMNRTEFFVNGELQETIIGPGPMYEYTYPLYYTDRYNVIGLIRNRKITDEYVKFNSIIVFVDIIRTTMPSFVQRFYAYDNAGWWSYAEILNPHHPVSIVPGLYLFQNMTLPHRYNGTIGRFFIKATFFDEIGVNQ
jgi:hypothetical protein